MSGVVRLLISLVVGLALGISYNAWPIDSQGVFGTGSGIAAQHLDIMSYCSGMLAGILLWQISSVPWAALPQRANAYLASQMHLYQFIALGGACVAILAYF